jgi:hypothetical protein
MSDELSALIRQCADEEATAAAREFHYEPAIASRFVRDIRRRRTAGAAMLAVGGLALVGAAALGLGRPWLAGPSEVQIAEPTPSVSPSPTRSRTPTSSPTVEPTPSVTPSPTESSPTPRETTSSPAPPVQEPPKPPGAAAITRAGPGGGSGEIAVAWAPVAGATGYRVYRSESPDGPFVKAARFDVASGAKTVEFTGAHEYITIWSAGDYLEYVEAVSGVRAYFRVVALNAAGEGPASGTACGVPLGSSDTC